MQQSNIRGRPVVIEGEEAMPLLRDSPNPVMASGSTRPALPPGEEERNFIPREVATRPLNGSNDAVLSEFEQGGHGEHAGTHFKTVKWCVNSVTKHSKIVETLIR